MDYGRLAGGVFGGVVAGLGLSALLIAGERKEGKPSELVDLERTSAARLGLSIPKPGSLPTPGEQAVVQGGHLLLSALAGATYAVTIDEDAPVVPSGLLFGAAFYAAMHWITGPALGVKQPEWQADGKTIGLHAANHLVFGLVVATFARALSRR